MLISFLLIGATNVNAETTAEVNNYSDLTDKMSDNVTDVVKLTSDITLREDSDTTFSLEMSKTLDFNGFTLIVPEHCRFKLIYENSLDLKFINSDSSKRAKLNLYLILATHQSTTKLRRLNILLILKWMV